ncbi:hypothetical protein, partial [Niveispirillum sp. KHB5.9]|uniref:hypothetical protein n=1 Tax=Niveispirillum sp. KHB5.9 TaxID=3400269 RepID=UPI003A87254A
WGVPTHVPELAGASNWPTIKPRCAMRLPTSTDGKGSAEKSMTTRLILAVSDFEDNSVFLHQIKLIF